MAPSSVSSDVEDPPPSTAKGLTGPTLVLLVTSQMIDGSPIPLLHRAMIVGTCLLLKDVVHKTRQRFFSPNKSTGLGSSSQESFAMSERSDTENSLGSAQCSKAKRSGQRNASRDYRVQFFSKSLGERESRYIYETVDSDLTILAVKGHDTTNAITEEF